MGVARPPRLFSSGLPEVSQRNRSRPILRHWMRILPFTDPWGRLRAATNLALLPTGRDFENIDRAAVPLTLGQSIDSGS
jgi:hypothetical protein